MRLGWFLTFACVLVIAGLPVFAKDAPSGEVKKLPRFVSLQSDEVNVRAGPGKRFPVKWILQRKNLPVEITQTYDVWRKIRDVDGGQGWVHEQMLTKARHAIFVTKDLTDLYAKDDENTNVVARVEPLAQVELVSCSDVWCVVGQDDVRGYTQKKNLFGVYEDERFD